MAKTGSSTTYSATPQMEIGATTAVIDARTYRVTHNGETREVEAPNPSDAWANVCDAKRSWPSPKTGKVEEVK